MNTGSYSVEKISSATCFDDCTDGLTIADGKTLVVAIDPFEIYNIQIEEYNPNNKYFYAFKVDDVFKVFKSGSWREIVRVDGDTYQYKDTSDAWVNADINHKESAISQAITISANRMSRSEINAIDHSNMADMRATELAISATTPMADDSRIVSIDIVGDFPLDDVPEGRDVKWRLISESNNPATLHGIRIRW